MMATLYDVDVRTINEHIKKIYSDSELEEDSTIRNFRIVQTEGSRQVSRDRVICFGIMGTSGMDTPYQMYQAYSIYIMSYGQYYLLTVVCGFIASMLAASVSMLVAAKMHTISVAICIPFFSFSDQVSWISDEKGIRIKDREYAEVMLHQIGYFPLMGGYKHLFHTPSARYYFSFSVSSIKAVIIFVSWPAALTPAFLQAAA